MKRLNLLTLLLSTFLIACSPLIPPLRSESQVQTLVARTLVSSIKNLRNSPTPIPPEISEPPTFTPQPTDTAYPTSTMTQAPTMTPSLTPLPASWACALHWRPDEIGLVMQVVDEATVRILLNGQIVTMHYIGLPYPGYQLFTPDPTHLAQNSALFGTDALAQNQTLVLGQIVVLVKDITDQDSFGNLLRYVFKEDVFVNDRLIREGYARAMPISPDLACEETFMQAEQAAMEASVGIWSDLSLVKNATAQNTGVPARMSQTATPQPGTTISTPVGLQPAGNEPCSCSGPDLDCRDFKLQPTAQACYDYCRSLGRGDIFRIDGDQNGKACELLPRR